MLSSRIDTTGPMPVIRSPGMAGAMTPEMVHAALDDDDLVRRCASTEA